MSYQSMCESNKSRLGAQYQLTLYLHASTCTPASLRRTLCQDHTALAPYRRPEPLTRILVPAKAVHPVVYQVNDRSSWSSSESSEYLSSTNLVWVQVDRLDSERLDDGADSGHADTSTALFTIGSDIKVSGQWWVPIRTSSSLCVMKSPCRVLPPKADKQLTARSADCRRIRYLGVRKRAFGIMRDELQRLSFGGTQGQVSSS